MVIFTPISLATEDKSLVIFVHTFLLLIQ